MRSQKLLKNLIILSKGGVCFGFLQGLQLVDFGAVLVSALNVFVQLLISTLLGGDVTTSFFL